MSPGSPARDRGPELPARRPRDALGDRHADCPTEVPEAALLAAVQGIGDATGKCDRFEAQQLLGDRSGEQQLGFDLGQVVARARKHALGECGSRSLLLVASDEAAASECFDVSADGRHDRVDFVEAPVIVPGDHPPADLDAAVATASPARSNESLVVPPPISTQRIARPASKERSTEPDRGPRPSPRGTACPAVSQTNLRCPPQPPPASAGRFGVSAPRR